MCWKNLEELSTTISAGKTENNIKVGLFMLAGLTSRFDRADVKETRCRSIPSALRLLLMMGVGLWTAGAQASSSGITGHSGDPATGGANCTSCHTPASTPYDYTSNFSGVS